MVTFTNNQLCIILVLLLCSCNSGSYTDTYNLDFERKLSPSDSIPNWSLSGTNRSVLSDSVVFHSGRKSLNVHVFESSDKQYNQPLVITQTLVLPDNAHRVEISFWYKDKTGQDYGSFKASLLDNQWNVIQADSINMTSLLDWTPNKVTLKGDGKLLNLSFSILQDRQIWLDGMKIKINGKDLYQYKPELDYARSSTALTNPIPTVDMSVMKGKKLIGIGESVHGQHEMAIARNTIIKNLIEENNCKLIILEAPDLAVEKLNDFVQGERDSVFSPAFVKETQFYIYCEEVFDLLKWVKIYNQSTTKKVVVAGMDVAFDWQYRFEDFLESLDQNNKDVIHIRELKSDNLFESLFRYIKDMKLDLQLSIGEVNYKRLLELSSKMHQIELLVNSGSSNKVRDEFMADNVVELIEKYTSSNETAVVCGHLGHINKGCFDGNHLIPSLGTHLTNDFGDNYYVIAQLVGNGTFQAYQIDTLKRNIKPLEIPINRSVEMLCEKMKLNDCFVELKNLPIEKNELYYVRLQGGIYRSNQFFPQQLQGGIDAITYTEKGTPLHFFQDRLVQFAREKK